jgi:hypothetical protein
MSEATVGQEIADSATLEQVTAKKREARRKLWQIGHLEWKFEKYPWARQMYDWTRARWGASPFLFWFVHRRGAKSTTGLVIALEECLRTPNTRCAVICKTKEQAQEICDLSMDQLLEDCPQAVMPEKVKNDYTYYFRHNGSRIVILPLDGKHSLKARGRKFRFILITEAGFIERVDKILRASILPAMNDVLGETVGTVVLESTPPEEPGHPMQEMVAEAEIDDRLFFLPLSQNRHASPAFVEKARKDSGGVDSIDYRREYELEFVVDDDRTAVPEATLDRLFKGSFCLVNPEKTLRAPCDSTGKLIKQHEEDADDLPKNLDMGGWTVERVHPPIVREVVYPVECDHYESLDPGGSDLTGWLGSTYLFEQDLVYVEDEITFLNMTTDDFAAKVRKHELALWGQSPRGRVRRFADNSNKRLLYDLNVKHKLLFTATAKDNKDAQINAVRVMFRDGRIAIHPRCTKLIKTLRLAKRAKETKRGFERAAEIGHADLLDCLLYKIRNVNRRALPPAPTQHAATAQMRPPAPKADQSTLALGRALGLSRFRR